MQIGGKYDPLQHTGIGLKENPRFHALTVALDDGTDVRYTSMDILIPSDLEDWPMKKTVFLTLMACGLVASFFVGNSMSQAPVNGDAGAVGSEVTSDVPTTKASVIRNDDSEEFGLSEQRTQDVSTSALLVATMSQKELSAERARLSNERTRLSEARTALKKLQHEFREIFAQSLEGDDVPDAKRVRELVKALRQILQFRIPAVPSPSGLPGGSGGLDGGLPQEPATQR